MELVDALTITVLGMGVVFFGLVLTALLILSFSWVPRLVRWIVPGGASGEEIESGSLAEASTSAATSGGPVDPQVLSVIAAVLEVEQRLYHPGLAGRLTIARRG